MRVLSGDESLGKSVARCGDADVEVDDNCNAERQIIQRHCTLFGVVAITKKMKEARLRWFGRVLRGEKNSVVKTATKLDVSGQGFAGWTT
ncbi:hypothetical protein RB195_006213 [Necator americanus]|uniref:Uncharacterized protein n=1 Tax=Necator americanus TaxID=51031 RepID=A0ABR1BRK1_NECAM